MANDEVLGPRKTMLVLVIVVGCFAVLWPRILSPLIVGHTQEQLKPNKFDREAGCCEVIFQSEVAVLELVNEVCNSALGVEKLSPQSAMECRKAVNESCGVDIAAFLKKEENIGKTTKMLVEAMKNTNSSCLREHFGVPIYSLTPHAPINSWTLQDSLKQERPLRGMGPHPALKERGRAIPPGVPPPGRQQMPPHIRVRSPLSVYIELEPPPIPGMRPPLGSPGGPVPAPKSSMGFVMPIYTICIIVFFVYTLSKIIFKRSAVPYDPVAPDPHFRRRVFRDDSRTTPDKLVVSAISGLVAEVQQQMEASQQRQESQDSTVRPYTNGTILNTSPVQIVTSEYQEAKDTASVKSKQDLSERKELTPENRDISEQTSIKNLTPIQEESVQTKECAEPLNELNQHAKDPTEVNESVLHSPLNVFETVDVKNPSIEQNNDVSNEVIETSPITDSFSLSQNSATEQTEHLNKLKEPSIEADGLQEISEQISIRTKESSPGLSEDMKHSLLKSKDIPETLVETVTEQKELKNEKELESLSSKTAPETVEILNDQFEQDTVDLIQKESSLEKEIPKDDLLIENEPILEHKESSVEKELKELYESSSEEELMPELLEGDIEREVSVSPEPEACITPDHRAPISNDKEQTDTEINSSIPSKGSTSDEDLIIIDNKEITSELNTSVSDEPLENVVETQTTVDETPVIEEHKVDKESLVLDNLNKLDFDKKGTVESTEQFLKEETDIATKDGPTTPELLAEALKEDSPKGEEDDNENSAVKVMGMETTAHSADGGEWRGERPALPHHKPQEHKAEEVQSIYLQTEIPQQARVLVADFEDHAHTQKPAKNAPLVVSGKMTLSLIQDAPRDTPERDLESTLDEFTTASAMTQPAAEKEELSDEEIEVEEIEEEEIEEEVEEELEEESDEEQPAAKSKK